MYAADDDDDTLQPPPSDSDTFDIVTTDEEAPADHDQLPSVQEYRAKMEAGNVSSKSLVRVDNPQDGDDNVHDQLPDVDDYKTSMSLRGQSQRTSRAGLYTFLALLLLTVIVTAIAVPLAMKSRGAPAETNPSSFGGETIMTATPIASPTRPPAMPPVMPELGRFDQTKSYLETYGLVESSALNDFSSPQYKAAKWIAERDGYQMTVPTFPDGHKGEKYSNTRFAERYALAVFYYATGGDNWKYKLNFLQPIDHCNWKEVFIDASGGIIHMGVTSCAQFSPLFDGERVTSIEISSNDLVGVLPIELEYLSYLDKWITPFNLKMIDTASLTPFLKMGEHLSHLELQYCGLAGNIPESFGNLKKLVFLGLGNNMLTGTIPDSFFGLTNLKVLGIDDNVLQSPIAPFSRMTQLIKLYAEDNLITGQLTESMISGWTEMVDLDISVNRLEGPIPPNIWSMENLEVLDLHGNDFIGQLPEIGSVNEKMIFLSLQNNSLEWKIPESIGNLPKLRHLDISANKFVLPFPPAMEKLTNLVSLHTGINGFEAHPVPWFLAGMRKLKEISMKQNKLTGEIPTWMGTFFDLQVLDLDFNELRGTIPSELGYLTGLDTLLLNRNYLEGTIPSSFANLRDIDFLVLDGNDITGNTEAICGSPIINTTFFSTDCGQPMPEVECSCCTLCCHDSNSTCNNLDWTVTLDGIWEYDFQRVVYSFSQDLLPSDAKDKYTVNKPMTATPLPNDESSSSQGSSAGSIMTATPIPPP